MVTSNIIFTSNVYPASGDINKDKQFISKVTDYTKLKGIKSTYFDGSSNRLNSLQERIVKEGAICSHAKKDPCWGLAKINSELTWVCKCVNIDCNQFLKCRPDFNDDEYGVFSSDVNNCDALYQYHEAKGENEVYYPVTYGSKLFDENKTLKKVDKTDKVNKTVKVDKTDSNIEIDMTKKIGSFLSNSSETGIQRVDVSTVADSVDDTHIDMLISTMSAEDPSKEIEQVTLVEIERSFDKMPDNIFGEFLTTQQEDIIQAPVADNVFIDAGPGTGKTYILIEKINYLVGELEVEPEAIQVLSFTNSAVTEIKNRLNAFMRNGGDRGLRNVDIRTFHSLSWYLIDHGNKNYVDQGWIPIDKDVKMDYEESIFHATFLISQFPDIVSGWTHFIVDEVQDLTGNKAELVLAIIKACLLNGCGFSVFGDSCQAIYDYVRQKDQDVITSDEFYTMLYQEVVGKGKFARLEKNHRQTDRLIDLTADLRSAILNRSKKEIACAVADLHSKVSQLPKPALLLEKSDIETLSQGDSVCFLCRNNGQTLSMSTLLRKRQIEHVLNGDEVAENFAPWIAEILFAYPESTISYKQFSELSVRNQVNFGILDAGAVWKRIQSIMKTRSEILNVNEFLGALRTSKVNDQLFRIVPTNRIVVSNIHKAKGREYDKVVLDDSFIKELESSQKDIGEYKTLYVAITRPKKELNTCKMSFDRVKSRPTVMGGAKRWFTQKYNKKLHMEIGLDHDVAKITFMKGNDTTKRQEYISRKIQQGDTIKLKRQIVAKTLSYLILHCSGDVETVIGKMSKSFLSDMTNLIRPQSQVDYPAYVEDLFVESVYTHIAEQKFGAAFPEIKRISQHGVWSWVNFRGLGHLIYDSY